jgi:hypothetical protein
MKGEDKEVSIKLELLLFALSLKREIHNWLSIFLSPRRMEKLRLQRDREIVRTVDDE